MCRESSWKESSSLLGSCMSRWGTCFFFFAIPFISPDRRPHQWGVETTERPIRIRHYRCVITLLAIFLHRKIIPSPSDDSSHVYVFITSARQAQKHSTTEMATPLFFSTFEVTRQAFHRTALAYAIVNLKPIVPGRTCAAPLADSPLH